MPDPGIHIDPPPAPRAPRTMYATFQFENTAEASVSQAGCLTTPAERPSTYCYFEVTATIPEPLMALSLGPLLVFLAFVGRARARGGQ